MPPGSCVRVGCGPLPLSRAPAAHWLGFADHYMRRVHATSNPHPGQSRSTSLLLLVLAPHHRLTPGGRAHYPAKGLPAARADPQDSLC